MRELTDTPGRYNFAHALIQHTLYEDLGPTRRARAHRQVAEALEDLCGDRPGVPGRRAGPPLVQRHPTDRPRQGHRLLPPGRPTPRSARSLPADALRYYAQALDLYAQADDPDPILGLDLAIGLGTAQRQTGDPAFRDTLLDAARRAADLGDTDRLVAAALANDRGFSAPSAPSTPTRSRSWRWPSSGSPADHPDRALVLATLCAELTYGSPLERRQALADEASPSPSPPATTPPSCGSSTTSRYPLAVPPLLDQSLARTADALLGPSGSATRSCCSGRR